MNEEKNKTKKISKAIGSRLEELEERAQAANASVHEVKTLLKMWDIIRCEASSQDEVDWTAVLLVIDRCVDQAIAVIEEIEKLGADIGRENDVAQRGC